MYVVGVCIGCGRNLGKNCLRCQTRLWRCVQAKYGCLQGAATDLVVTQVRVILKYPSTPAQQLHTCWIGLKQNLYLRPNVPCVLPAAGERNKQRTASDVQHAVHRGQHTAVQCFRIVFGDAERR
jgi:hypothetical protein